MRGKVANCAHEGRQLFAKVANFAHEGRQLFAKVANFAHEGRQLLSKVANCARKVAKNTHKKVGDLGDLRIFKAYSE